MGMQGSLILFVIQTRTNTLPLSGEIAASATSTIFSPVAFDKAADLNRVRNENAIVSGQVQGFSASSILAFVEAAIGGVGGDPSQNPGRYN